MRAVQLQQTDRTTAIAEHDKVLAEDAKLERQLFQIVRIADWLPKTAHVLAARCIRADMGQLGIFLRHTAVMEPTVASLKERRPRHHRNLLCVIILRGACPQWRPICCLDPLRLQASDGRLDRHACSPDHFSETTCFPPLPPATSISLASLFAIASAKELKSSTTIKKALGPPITFCR